MGILERALNIGEGKQFRRYEQRVDAIAAFEPELELDSDAELLERMDELRQRARGGEALDELLPECFALVRETGRRRMGMRHFDVQMIGAMVLHGGSIAEMRTGEGKTLTATLAAKPVADTREYGVVLHDAQGRITGFQEKPEPADARSDLGNCGIYCLEPAVFDYFPKTAVVDWAHDVFPALLERSAPFYVHRMEEYWNDIGSLAELRQGTFDALAGELRIELAGVEIAPGVTVGEGSDIGATELLEGPVWIGRDVVIGAGARLSGPLAIGDGARIGAGAALRDSIVFPGTEVAARTILIGAIAGHFDIAASLRPRGS